MKVALFFDGKNFYSGWRERASKQPVDFTLLSRWLVQRVGGDVLWGSYYYTGVETAFSPSSGNGQSALSNFLDNLEMLPGFFVKRFPRSVKSYHCRDCNAENYFTQENEVDTTMVADMLRLAASGAFDIMVLMSGDADHAPAIEGVRAMGRQAYVATWGGVGLSRRIRRAAFDHIDLVQSLADCTKPLLADEHGSALIDDAGVIPISDPRLEQLPLDEPESHVLSLPKREMIDLTTASSEPTDILLDEVRRAQSKFPMGYVGVNFFIHRWQASNLDPDPNLRRELIERMIQEERLELYMTDEGTKAIRVSRISPSQSASAAEL